MTPDPTVDPIQNQSTASERQTSDWDIRNAPRNYISLVVFQAGSALFSFGAVWLITRHLGSEGYGGIVAIIAASQVAQVLVNWTSVAVVRFGVDEFIETEKIARTFWVRFIVLAANLILVAALSTFWFPPLADWLKLAPGSFWLVMTHFAVTVIWIHVQMSLQGAKLPRVQGFLQMVERLLIFAGLFILTAAANLTPYWAIIFYIVAPAAMTVLGLYELRKYITARFSIDRIFVRKIVAYSLPLFPMSLVGYFSGSYVDAVFVSKFLSTRDLGIYSVATQINGITLQLPSLANILLIPLFITLQKEDQSRRLLRFFQDVIPAFTLAWGVCCTLLAFICFFVLPVLFGTELSEAVLPLWILLTSAAISLPGFIGYSALSHAISATYITLVSATASAVVNLSLNFVLIPKFGLVGCALSTLFACYTALVVSGLLLRKRTMISFSWVFYAMIPVLAGAISLGFGNPLLALIVCVSIALLIGFARRGSIYQTLAFIKQFRAVPY